MAWNGRGIQTWRWSGIAACAVMGALAAASLVRGADTAKAAAELHARFAADLEQLAKWCESKGLTDETRKTRRVLGPADPNKLYMPVLPETIGPAKLPADAPADVVEWDSRLNRLRRERATAFYELARRAARTGRAAVAFELAMASIQADPDYEPVRRLFGYQRYKDQWRTPYDVKKLRAGNVWTDEFGWLPKSHLRRYQEGQRYCDGRWISAEDDAKRHADIRAGWVVETEHYSIRTNHGIKASVSLGVKLERLYRLWQQIFLRYYAAETDVIAMFDGRAKASIALPRHDVVYFRDRDDYNRTLRPLMPNIEITAGMYRDRPSCAYFFAGKESDDRTMYHEATHQLFHEARQVAPDVGRLANFWIVEGIAMYMETLRQEDGFYVLGGFDDDRMRAARYRLIEDEFYVPLGEFAAYGRERFQKDRRLPTLYSQAAGLAEFLVYYDNGRYRDALVAYLVLIYTGRDGPDTLAKLTGAEFSELDRQYREFMQAKP
jgi:hypothetical protein